MWIFGKKKEEKTSCCCNGNCNTQKETEASTNQALIKVLGSGCDKCNQLEATTKEALKELNMDTNVDHVTDFTEIALYGVMVTPALVIGETVVSSGKLLKKDEIIDLIKKHTN